MRSRCLLHVDKAEDFIAWAKNVGHKIEPPKGSYVFTNRGELDRNKW